jgi:glycosyltransferase involved in cell wall biosynthesis
MDKLQKNDRPKLLFVVTEDWYFVSHRLQLAVAASEAGFEVVVATRVKQHGNIIREAGIRLLPLELSRRIGNPLMEIMDLFFLYRRERPDIVHHVALKPVFLGGLAGRLAGFPAQVNAVAGLGWLFTSRSRTARWINPLIRWARACLLNFPRCRVIVQNPDDAQLLKQFGIPESNLRLIRGVGVNTIEFSPKPEPQGPVCVVMASRMLWIKGVGEFVKAARLLKESNVDARFILAGYPDSGNPASVPEEQLNAWQNEGVIEFLGHQEDMPTVIEASHVMCLPSHGGEGVPKVLLEAAACGRPIITTDTPGCREVVRDGYNGLLIPARNSNSLADALLQLINNTTLRTQMGQRSREIALADFSSESAIAQTLKCYEELIK